MLKSIRINPISFKKGKTTFQVLYIVLFQLTSITCQLNLYNTDQTFKSDSLQFDCLNYDIYHKKLAYQELSDLVRGGIPLSQNLSFEQMCVANIAVSQLLSCSIPIKVAERYQFYLNELNFSLNEYFYNCTEGRFGLRWQTFPCGDGPCVHKFEECYNSRHILLIDSMTTKGNLTDECWIATICLTGFVI